MALRCPTENVLRAVALAYRDIEHGVLLVVEMFVDSEEVAVHYWLVSALWSEKKLYVEKSRLPLQKAPRDLRGVYYRFSSFLLLLLSSFVFDNIYTSILLFNLLSAGGHIVSIGCTPNKRVLVGVAGSSNLDAFHVESSGQLSSIGSLSFNFPLFSFVVGHTNGSVLLFATERGASNVRLLLLPDDADPKAPLQEDVEQLRRIAGEPCSLIVESEET